MSYFSLITRRDQSHANSNNSSDSLESSHISTPHPQLANPPSTKSTNISPPNSSYPYHEPGHESKPHRSIRLERYFRALRALNVVLPRSLREDSLHVSVRLLWLGGRKIDSPVMARMRCLQRKKQGLTELVGWARAIGWFGRSLGALWLPC